MQTQTLNLIKPHIEDIEKFVKHKELRPKNPNFWNDIKQAYELEGGDKLTVKKVGTCNSCNKRVLNDLFRRYEQHLLESSKAAGKSVSEKPKRGRPRKQNKSSN